MKIVNFLKSRFRKYLNDEHWLKDYIQMGLKVGENCNIQPGLVIDHSNCWLIQIGNNVTIAPQVYLLAHDASTKSKLGCTKIGKIIIEDNCFIGARALIMPNVTVCENSIIASGSIVTKNVKKNTVVGGNPAKVICSVDDYFENQKKLIEVSPKYDQTYSLDNITTDKKIQMNKELTNKIGFRY
ncbi:acyltransferase [Pseudotamlana agarivorans]|uniref:acyltransferase n=1 Tax=Pseudotamlana agarivorans TaxID=481183 RepID=UPI00083579AA|nr:acyltransferase [Tamlana agarivorans]